MRKLLFMLLVSLLLVACSEDVEQDQDNEPEENVVEEPEEEPEKEESEEPEYANVFPLTGIGTDEDVDNRIVGVMVNNHTKARPQSGLSQADIVFEILAEGKITRLLALFHSEQPKIVGPVRSAREYYFDLANRYGAIYVYHGAADFIDEMIVNRGINFLNGSTYDNDGHLFKREDFRVAPHNSYLLFDSVYEVAEGKGYDITGNYDPLPFYDEDELTEISGDEANHVEITYSTNPMNIVEYEYDETTEKYTRYNDREKTIELETEEPIQLDNVFIVETPHQVIDDAGRREIDFYSGGNAYLLQKGTLQKVEWENRDGRIVPIKDGEPVDYVPGKTWINVVPTNPGMEQSVIVTNE
ncbi:DUF3048 domain-containing protein [Ornithinibacillus sp. L9]|uniref:DUF3048 domain-containing protein n=1 Tax=Ornithinibacillus caprae TaxID=2678566 RepID=A0A6N8FJF5_9BACI|nr:DUF3048 domain-containing protein [Ornithinibacillus caprae]MUK88434.1 DUF3048 domain-containing protein [Ornithinibacillus caprae]